MNMNRTRYKTDRLPCIECLKRDKRIAEKKRMRARRIAIVKWLAKSIFQALYPLVLVVSMTEGWMVM